MTHTLTFGLLANSRAFLESAIEYVTRGRTGEYRFAILHLATALELLLKVRLAAKDPQLLVEGTKRIVDIEFERGAFRSVGPDEALKRLTDAGLLLLTDRQRKQLSSLRSMRNRVTHYIDSTDIVEAKAVVGAGVHLFLEIYNAAFQSDDVYGAKSMPEVAGELYRFDAFVKERVDQLRNRLRGAVRPRTHHLDECSNCLQDAAIIVDDRLECLFCGRATNIRDCAEVISEDGSVAECPACGRQSVARLQWRAEEPTYECFCCGYFTGPEVNWCDHSGQPIPRLRESA